MPILFQSTNNHSKPVSFKTALLSGLAPDKGLFLPTDYPVFSKELIHDFHRMSYPELACSLLYPFLSDDITEQKCFHLAERAYDFEVPLERIDGNRYLLRLDRGPTHSFKDFGARMMALLMEHVRQNESGKLIVLTATSGDTGGAIASAFLNMDNIEVVVLFPRDEISNQQRKQMTTLGKNIQSIAIEGKFDDCQALVKQAFADPDLTSLNLTSANSINIGRLLPQSVYYFWAFTRTALSHGKPVIFSIPSGNFGNACGCLFAKRMGLPVSKLVLPTNSNDSFTRFLKTGIYRKTEPSVPCISSAMNVGHPSNLARIITLYGGTMDEEGNLLRKPDFDSMIGDIFSVSISEEKTRETIHRFYREFGVMLEPHGAVGLAGLEHFLAEESREPEQNHQMISLETAHPAKFPEEIRKILSMEPDQPESFAEQERKNEVFEVMDRKYQTFKEYLLSNK